jgi:hypothetical protein
MSMMVKKIMESDDTLKVAVIKYEIDIIEMREVKGRVIMTENYPDLVVDQGERTTTRTKRIPKTEDEAEEEEEVDGLLAVSCSFSGLGVLLKTSISFTTNFFKIS